MIPRVTSNDPRCIQCYCSFLQSAKKIVKKKQNKNTTYLSLIFTKSLFFSFSFDEDWVSPCFMLVVSGCIEVLEKSLTVERPVFENKS